MSLCVQIFALIIAAACHDVEHNGVNNAFHVRCMTPVAVMHNDRSVLENHHCAVMWALLQRPDTNILSGLDAEQLKAFREMVTEMILGTDMSLRKRLLDCLIP